MLRKSIKGLSLLEAFISSIIFVIATAAIFTTLSGLRKPAVNNEQALGGALAMRNVLEDLRAKISQSDINPATSLYTSGNLTDGAHGPVTMGGTYNVYYNVTTNMATGVRMVNAWVTWNDVM